MLIGVQHQIFLEKQVLSWWRHHIDDFEIFLKKMTSRAVQILSIALFFNINPKRPKLHVSWIRHKNVLWRHLSYILAKKCWFRKVSSGNLKTGKLPVTLPTWNFQELFMNNFIQNQINSKQKLFFLERFITEKTERGQVNFPTSA